VTDSLNHTIDRLFRQAGIEIAFPQLDVHLFRAPPKKPPSSGPEDN
jgi:potassium efflux system protein